MKRQRRKICHFIYFYRSRWSGLVSHCYRGLKSFKSFCFHWRSPLGKGDKYCDKLNSTYLFFPICLGGMWQRKGQEEGPVEPGAGLSDGINFSLLISSFTYIMLWVNKISCFEEP